MKRYALTAVGRDRPGIVAAVTKALYEHDCNIEDSSMTILEDEFAIILVMTMPEKGDVASLEKAMKDVEKKTGLFINLKEIPAPSAAAPTKSNYIITLHGADKAGIVYRTSKTLADLGVNITDLETKAIRSGDEKAYMMVLEVFSPEKVKIKELEKQLKELEKSLGVTIRIKPVEEYEPL
ncbi:MAG TPA: ACT domain-containing protein [Thermodesulfobacteriota bacterium]|nr:ACT domain-containing protein [Thermodesulfobacteriota bacterium]